MDQLGDGTRICPMCAEDIKAAARICRFCRTRLDSDRPAELYRHRPGRQVAGVAAAVAGYLNWSVTFVRLLFVVATFINGLGVIAYLAMWLLLPAKPGGTSLLGRVFASLNGVAAEGAVSDRSIFERGVERVRDGADTLRARMSERMSNDDDQHGKGEQPAGGSQA